MKLIVVGGGPGGYTAAVRAAQKGYNTVLIEKNDLGGTCLNRGCIPSKIFRRSADIADDLKKMDAYGFEKKDSPAFSMAGLQARKQRVVQTQQKGIKGLLDKNKVTLVQGEAVLGSPGQVNVRLNSGGTESMAYDKLILAMGSYPLSIPAFPIDHGHILSSDDVLDWTDLPESLVIIGGGVVGCEFAFILSSLGVKVTVVETLDRMLCLPGIGAKTSRLVEVSMKKNKVKPLFGRTVTGVEIKDGGCRVELAPAKEKEGPQYIEAQKVLVTVGRKPATAGLNLEQAGIGLEKGFIPVNGAMETSVEGIFAIGDTAWAPGKQMLAHVAAREAEIAVAAIAGKDAFMSYGTVPGGIFTSPEIASVGMTLVEAKQAKLDASDAMVMFRTLGKIQALGKLDGHAIVTFDPHTHRILGFELAGAHATDIIAQAALLVEKKMTLEDVCDTIHAHPTVAEIMMEVCHKAKGTPLHG